MKLFVSGCLVTAICLGAAGQPGQAEDVSLLRLRDVAYSEATELARFLNEHNLHVKSIHRRGVPKAAFFRTDKNVMDVIFFPDAGAEKVAVTERRKKNRYIYSFQGQPQPNPPGDTFNSAKPMYFIMSGNLFIVVSDKDLSSTLKSVLAGR